MICYGSIAQNLDSLIHVVEESTDSTKVDAANYVAYFKLVQGDTTLLDYLKIADSIAKSIDYKKGQGDAQFVYGMYYYYYPTDYVKSLDHYKKSS